MNNPSALKGIHISLKGTEPQPHTQPHVVVRPAEPRREIFQSDYIHQHHQNMTMEQLNGAKFTESVGHTGQNQDTHFSYPQGSKSKFIPERPERFLPFSGHTPNQPSRLFQSGHGFQSGQSFQPSHPSQLPVNSNHVHTVHTTQPLVQSVNRHYVAQHFINEIPVMVSETKRYEEADEEGINEADQQMLEQYEKLYGSYMEEKARNEHLSRQLREYELKVNESQGETAQVREVIHTQEVDRPKKIDVRLLASLLVKKNKAVIDDLVERRKGSCLNKLRSLFEEEEASIKTTILRSSEQFVRVRSH